MKATDKTLIEQMKISDMEINSRMELLNIDHNTLNLMKEQKILIEENIEAIVNEFYKKQTAIDEISMLIGDADSLRRLFIAQQKYVTDLFSGIIDGDYVNNRLRIGMVHKRIGVKPKLYFSAIKLLKDIIAKILKQHISNEKRLEKTLDILDRLLYFDTTLVVDTYIIALIKEIQTEKKKTETYAENLEEIVAIRTKQLEEQTKKDPLTGLFNHKAMHELFKRELILAKRRNTKISVVYLDVDKFKSINDKLGHIKGDEVLKSLSRILIDSIRETDIPCRYGGDEFFLIFPDCNIDNAKKICDKVISKFTSKYPDFSLSMGISEAGNGYYPEIKEMILDADQKMYKAKQTEGSMICL